MWIRICKRFEIGLGTERLVRYRIRDNNQNLSSSVRDARTEFERKAIYMNFLDETPLSLLSQAFPDFVKNEEITNEQELEVAKSLIYLSHSHSAIRAVGATRLFHQFDDEYIRETLLRSKSFSLRDYFDLTLTLESTVRPPEPAVRPRGPVDNMLDNRPWLRFAPLVVLQKFHDYGVRQRIRRLFQKKGK